MANPRQENGRRGDRSLWSVALTGFGIVVAFSVIFAVLALYGSPSLGWGMMGGWSSAWGWLWVALILLLVVPLFLTLVLFALILRPAPKPVALVFSPVGRRAMPYTGRYVASDEFEHALDDIVDSRWCRWAW